MAIGSSACTRNLERVEYQTLDSAAEGEEMNYAVYTPPGWDGQQPLPLVVFLHGAGDDERALGRHPEVANTLDAWIESGRLPPFIMVVPDGNKGMWTNWDDGTHHYEDYVISEVIPRVRADFPTIEGKQGLHLMGISMGGAGTMRIAMKHRAEFASATVISAPIFDVQEVEELVAGKGMGRMLPVERIWGSPSRETIERENPYTALHSVQDLEGMQLMVASGEHDILGIPENNDKFHRHLASDSIPHRYLVYDGGHRWTDWRRVVPVSLCKQLAGSDCELPEDDFYTLVEVAAPSEDRVALQLPR
jgi:enterochelin esterase-like enzyme